METVALAIATLALGVASCGFCFVMIALRSVIAPLAPAVRAIKEHAEAQTATHVRNQMGASSQRYPDQPPKPPTPRPRIGGIDDV